MRLKLTFLASAILMTSMVIAQQKPYTKAELDASNIIRLCNSVIELSNKNRASTDNYESMLSTAESNINKLKRNPDTQPLFVNYKNFQAYFGNKSEYTLAYKAAPAFAEKKGISDAVAEADSNIENAVKWATIISKYFSEKEYANDADFSKYPAMKDSLTYYFQKGYTAWGEASKLASKAGNNAELILLQKSKIAEFIIPMKTDMNSIDAILDTFKSESFDSAQIKTAISEASASITKNKDISTKDIKKLSDIYYKSVYQDFYMYNERAIEAMNQLMQEIETDPTKSDRLESIYSLVVSNYKNAVEAYNTFVGQ